MVEATQDAIDAGGTVISLDGAAAAGARRGGGRNGAPAKENRR
jgi:hypothetical protein